MDIVVFNSKKSSSMQIKVLMFFLSLLLYPAILLATYEIVTQQDDVQIVEEKSFKAVSAIRNIDDFKCAGVKTTGVTKGNVCTANSEPGSYYIVKFGDKKAVMRDFVGAFVLRKIIGDGAPLNYIVELKDGSIALASKKITNYTSIDEYIVLLAQKHSEIATLVDLECMNNWWSPQLSQCKNSLFYKKWRTSREVVDGHLLANFIKHTDYHFSNAGFICKNNEIVSSASIDFDDTLSDLPMWWHREVGHDDDNLPVPYYLAGIDNALLLLKKVSSFDISYLDELNQIFIRLNEKYFLDDIKQLLSRQLMDVTMQIETCELVKRIIASGTFTEAEFNKLVNAGYILTNFQLANGENTLVNLWCDKNDVLHIKKALSAEKKLAESFVKYCLGRQQYKLLEEVALEVNQTVLAELLFAMLWQGKTIEHFKLILKVAEKTEDNPYATYCNIIEKCLDSSFDINVLHELSKKNRVEPCRGMGGTCLYQMHNYLFERLKNVVLCHNPISKLNGSYDEKIAFIQEAIVVILDSEDRLSILNDFVSDLGYPVIRDVLLEPIMFYGDLELLRELLKNIANKDHLRDVRNAVLGHCTSMRCKNFQDFKEKIYEIIDCEMRR